MELFIHVKSILSFLYKINLFLDLMFLCQSFFGGLSSIHGYACNEILARVWSSLRWGWVPKPLSYFDALLSFLFFIYFFFYYNIMLVCSSLILILILYFTIPFSILLVWIIHFLFFSMVFSFNWGLRNCE